jgi:exopolysaccharide biosynthesis polyprenyl glycosylphosphotransferase
VYRRTLAFADALAAVLALLMTRTIVGPGHPSSLALAAVPLIVLMSKVVGIYDRQDLLVRKSTLDEAPVLFQVATMYALIVWLLNGFIITQSSNRRELLVEWILLFLLLLVVHVVARWLARALTTPERCLVIGEARACERIQAKLARRPSLHAVVVAYIPIEPLGDGSDVVDVLADGLDLSAITSQVRVDRIIVAPERCDADEALNLIRAASSIGVKVSLLPRMLEVIGSSVEFDDVEGRPLLCMRSASLSRSSHLIKRSLDVTLAGFGLVLLSPLLEVIAAAIKLDSRGPVLFRQLRVGRDDRPFEMLKFRTMVDGAHERREDLRHLNEADGLFKIAQDPRVTRIGSVLRRLSLDELPQLWNVLRGDMSVVGPRPLVIEEDQRIHGWHRRRLQLTPGMTGHWQILGSARIPLHEMVKIDYLYVTNWSLWNDIKIMIRTIPFVIGRRGM